MSIVVVATTAKLVMMVWTCFVKDDNDLAKKCMEYEVVGSRPRGRPKRTWLEVVQRDCQVRGLSKDDAMVRGR